MIFFCSADSHTFISISIIFGGNKIYFRFIYIANMTQPVEQIFILKRSTEYIFPTRSKKPTNDEHRLRVGEMQMFIAFQKWPKSNGKIVVVVVGKTN